jgi:hypothetical protein
MNAHRSISDQFGLELGVYPLFWGARIGFNIAEFADLLLGCCGLDIFGDDGRKRPPTLPFVPSR